MTIRTAIESTSVLLGIVAGLLLFYLVLGIGTDVTLRGMTGRGIPSIAEYADIVLVGLVYLSLARTQFDGGHVTSDLIAMRMPPRVRCGVELAGMLIVLVILAAITWYTAHIAYESYLRGEYRLGLTGALIWPARWAIVIGLIAWQMQLWLRVFDLFLGIRRGTDVDDPSSTDTLL
ncbi:MAG: TRAP transporter small permease [Ectothiorhodospiraceae bacterium]|nr:TRAP transporter small permease [Ectothiorhodospiraceae bacterium]